MRANERIRRRGTLEFFFAHFVASAVLHFVGRRSAWRADFVGRRSTLWSLAHRLHDYLGNVFGRCLGGMCLRNVFGDVLFVFGMSSAGERLGDALGDVFGADFGFTGMSSDLLLGMSLGTLGHVLKTVFVDCL